MLLLLLGGARRFSSSSSLMVLPSPAELVRTRFALVQRLERAKNAKQLLLAINSLPLERYDAVTCTSALRLATKTAFTSPEALQHVLLAVERISDFPPSNLAQCMESFAKQKRGAGIPNQLLAKIGNLHEYSAADLSTLAWSLAKTKAFNPNYTTLMRNVASELLNRRSLSDFTPNELARTAWALQASNGNEETTRLVLDKIAKEVMSQGLGAFTPSQLCSVVAAMLECENATLLAKVGREIQEIRPGFLKELSNRHLADLLRAFSRSEQSAPSGTLVHMFAKDLMLRTNIASMDPNDFCDVVQALALLLDEGEDTFVFHKLLGDMDFAKFTASQVAKVCLAMFPLRIRPNSNAVWMDKAMASLSSDGSAASMALLCLAKWRVRPSEDFLRAVLQQQQASLETIWGLACLDLFSSKDVVAYVQQQLVPRDILAEEEITQMQQIALAWQQASHDAKSLFPGLDLTKQVDAVRQQEGDDDAARALRQRIASIIMDEEDAAQVEIEAFAAPGVQVDVLLRERRLVLELEPEENTLENGQQNGFAHFQRRLLEREHFTVHYIPPTGFELLELEEQVLFVQKLLSAEE